MSRRQGTVFAIGGGGFADPKKRLVLDRELFRLSGKTHPRMLVIPTASGDKEPQWQLLHFGGRLGCRIDVLNLLHEKPSLQELRKRILGADIIFVGGGNTYRMLKIWKRRGVDRILKEAYQRGKVLAGISAGAICWFQHGNSDSRKKHPKDKTLIRVSGMSWLDGFLCPHYDSEPHRQLSLKNMMRKSSEVAIALEDFCGIEVSNGAYRIVAEPGKKAYRIFWQGGKYYREVILQATKWASFHHLVHKPRS